MSSRAARTVAVLKGGLSAEREVSLSTGAECAKALRHAGFTVIEIDAGRDLSEQLRAAAPDVVFNALHGRFGEDGSVQGLLDWMGIPYTHSGVLASAMSMDKTLTKERLAAAGLPVAEGKIIHARDLQAGHPMAAPYVVKPNADGSSVGVFIVHPGDAVPSLPEKADEDLLVERFVPGRELTSAVMGERVLGVTEIVTDGWYDYDAKYRAGGSRHILPAEIPAEIEAACRDYALRTHQVMGCRGLTRTDFRWDETRGLDGLIILEINTQPGMTPTSLAPEQAAFSGISFPDLCAWLVEEAKCAS